MPEIEILYEDNDFLSINKPAGLLSIPDGYNPQLPHLLSALEREYGKLWIVHRLDKETSGVMVLARNSEAHRSLNHQFSSRAIQKEYHAIIIGTPGWRNMPVNLPLLVNGDRKHRTVVSDLGKPACTDFYLGSQGTSYSYLLAYPHNGYTHQIRAHIAALGFPILSDFLYQKKDQSPPVDDQKLIIPRHALHAAIIRLEHPGSHAPLILSAPLPEDFKSAIHACNFEEINKPPLPDWH